MAINGVAELVMTVDAVNADRAAWLKARRSGIGGSDAGIILGVSHWSSTFALWQDKTGQAPLADEEQISPELKEIFHFGHVLEDVVAKEFEERTGKKVRRIGMIRNNERPWLLADVDRVVVGENAILECKTTNSFNKDMWEGDNIPDSYYIQCQHYMACGGYDKCYIACLIGGQQFMLKEIPRNDEDIKVILDKEEEFWKKYVEPKEFPPADDSKEYASNHVKYFPGGEKDVVEFDNDIELLCRDIAVMKEDKYKLESAIEAKQNKIREWMGNHEHAAGQGFKVTYTAYESERLDSKALKAEMPKVYEKYVKTTKQRRFLITEKKGKK